MTHSDTRPGEPRSDPERDDPLTGAGILPAPPDLNWKWTLAMGAVMVLGGIVALTNPFVASLTVQAVAAATFAAAGAIQIYLAITRQDGSTGARALAAGLGVLLILFALSLVAQPIAGLISLTILVAAFFTAAGIVRVLWALRMERRRAWGWILASGLVSIALGFLIFLGLPGAALGILGIFLGLELIMAGAASIMLALRARGE